MSTIEISEIDIRYKHCHIRDPSEEKRLLNVLMREGIQRALLCVKVEGISILIDGFKRYRCAQVLHISLVPVKFLPGPVAEGMLELMFRANEYKLTILEEARMISEIKDLAEITIDEISKRVNRSRSWVFMRINIMKEMKEDTLKIIFDGSFPVYSWMSSVRPRLHKSNRSLADAHEFVKNVGGKGISLRDIDQLAWAYFEGTDNMRNQIQSGNLDWILKELKETDSSDQDTCLPFERTMLKKLSLSSTIMTFIIRNANDKRLQKKAFFAQAHIITGRLLGILGTFKDKMEKLHDRCEYT